MSRVRILHMLRWKCNCSCVLSRLRNIYSTFYKISSVTNRIMLKNSLVLFCCVDTVYDTHCILLYIPKGLIMFLLFSNLANWCPMTMTIQTKYARYFEKSAVIVNNSLPWLNGNWQHIMITYKGKWNGLSEFDINQSEYTFLKHWPLTATNQQRPQFPYNCHGKFCNGSKGK